MAYGLKYTYNFNQLKNYGGGTTDEWLINIYLDGYVGSSSEIAKIERSSIVLSRDGDLLENVQGTKLTFGIFNQTEAEYKEFRTAAWGDYKAELIKDPNGTPVTKFIGYNQSEIYTEPYDQPPYISKLEFTDGLNHLNHVRWDDSGTLYTGQKTIIEVIRLALNKLPSPLKIREICNVYEDSINSTTTDSMFNQIYVASEVYKEEKDEGGSSSEVGFYCNHVLESVLKPFGAHLFQANGIWYIIRPQEYLDSTMYYREFNANVGTESTVTVDATGSFASNSNRRTVTGYNGTSTELILHAPATEMSIEPPLNRIKLTYNQDNLEQDNSNLIKNSCFDEVTGTTPAFMYPTYWTIVGSNYLTYQAISGFSNEKWYQFEPVAQGTATSFASGVYMEQTKAGVVTATTDALQFSFDFIFQWTCQLKSGGTPSNAIYNFINNDLFITYEIEIKFGSYYLQGDAASGYSWTTTVSRAFFTKTGFAMSGSYVMNHSTMYTFNETLPTMPQSANVSFRIRVYRAYSNISTFMATQTTNYNYSFKNIWQRCIELVYLPDENPPIEELVLYAEIDEDENIEDIECIHGDGTNSASLNSFRLSNGTITDVWNRRGKADNSGILSLLLITYRDLMGEFTRNLSGQLTGEIDVYNTIQDTTDVTTTYYIKTYEWNIETSEIGVNLMELIASAVSQTIVTSVTPRGLSQKPPLTDNSTPAGGNPASKIVAPSPIMSGSQTNLNGYN